MLGIADRLYTLNKSRNGYKEPEIDWKPEVIDYNKKETSWFCFVPRSVSRISMLRKGIIPAEGNVFVYKISSLNLIKPNPEETVEGLQEIYDDAIRRMNQAITEGRTLNMIGVSLGNVLAIRAAGSIDSRIGRLVSIVGGGKLGLSAWDGILTGYIARQSGFNSPEEYERELSIFSPVNYVGGIVADEIFMRFGTRDLLIPFKHGQELARALINRGDKTSAKVDYRAYRGADHSATLVLSALERILFAHN